MLTRKKNHLETLVGTAILGALVIVLQGISTAVSVLKPGGVNFTLALTPIILGAVLYGPWIGALLGCIMGGIVAVAVVTGGDPGGFMMFDRLPALTVFLCLFKSAAAGLAAGFVAMPFKKRNNLFPGVILAAVTCPIVNTSVFCAALFAFYREEATIWMGEQYSNIFIFTLTAIIGINFVIEFFSNVILAPGIERVIYAIRRNR